MNTTQHSSLFWSLDIASDTRRPLNKEAELPRARCNRFKPFFFFNFGMINKIV